jgi:hypothetical protein
VDSRENNSEHFLEDEVFAGGRVDCISPVNYLNYLTECLVIWVVRRFAALPPTKPPRFDISVLFLN